MLYNISLENLKNKVKSMIINPQILNELCDEAGSAREERAQEYVNKKRVNIKKVIYDNINNFEIRALVKGNGDNYAV